MDSSNIVHHPSPSTVSIIFFLPFDLLQFTADSHSYNSVIFSTTSAVNYEAYIVSQTFTDSGFNNSADPLFVTLHTKALNGSLKEMANSECISTFNQNYVADYANGKSPGGLPLPLKLYNL